MKRFGPILLRAAITAGGAAGVTVLVANSDGSAPVIVLGAVLLLATGALVDRYWAAALPLVYVVVAMAIDAVVNGTEDGSDMSWWGYAYLFALVAAGVSLIVLAGVVVGRVVRRQRGRRRAGSAGNRGIMA